MTDSGFRVVNGLDKYNHFFGGQTWNLPTCPQCKEPIHQIFTFDLADPQLFKFKSMNLKELPLISCLNCSLYEHTQTFSIDSSKCIININSQTSVFDWKYDDIDKLPVPLPKSSVKLTDMTRYDMDINNNFERALEAMGTEYICRLMGPPIYIEESIVADCPNCQKEMQYVATVVGEDYDIEKHLIKDVIFQIGESSIFFFFCKNCLIIKTEMQST